MFIGFASWPRATAHRLGGGSLRSSFGPKRRKRAAVSSESRPALRIDAGGRRHIDRGSEVGVVDRCAVGHHGHRLPSSRPVVDLAVVRRGRRATSELGWPDMLSSGVASGLDGQTMTDGVGVNIVADPDAVLEVPEPTDRVRRG